MDTKKSFFRRNSDAEQREIQEYTPRQHRNEDSDEQQEHSSERSAPRHRDQNNDRPQQRSSERSGAPRYRSQNSDDQRRGGGGSERRDPRYRDQDNRAPQRDFRAPRGERTDYRKPENRLPRAEEEREAPENIIYGIHPIKEAIETAKVIEKIYFRSNSFDNEAIAEIRDMVRGTNIVCQDVPNEKLDRLTRRGNHQGVVAVIPEIEYADFNALLDKLTSAEVAPLVVVVDSVTDIRNFGAIARSAECAGAEAIIMSAKNSAPVNAEAIRSSAGALNVIPVCRVGSLRNALKSLQMAGLQLIAATEKSNDIIFDADFTKPTVIVMGSEDKGISTDILKMCDKTVAIPLLGKIESLNVSAAASVMLFEAVRQRFMAIDAE